jgi:energy-coupling factor transporter ATP-binding protein EcfA2
LRLLLDLPESEAIFGFNDYATALTSTILDTDPHFTIAIFGKWGSGKTTLLKKIETILKSSQQNRVLPVFFDAWRYQHEEHMILPLLDTVAENLKRQGNYWRDLGNAIGTAIVSLASAITVKTYFAELSGPEVFKQAQSARQEIRSDYYKWLNELQRAVDTIRKDDSKRRIVVIIDDLDRCLPYKVVEVLESIKTILDIEGFIFVVALDEEVAKNSIESHYGDKYRDQSKEYLKKLIQVEFRLPPLRTEDVLNYTQVLQTRAGIVDKQVSTVLSELVPMIVGGNPREVKRFINSVLLATEIMKRAGVTLSFNHQIAFMAMEFRWPGISAIISDESIRSEIREYIEAKKDDRGASLSEERVKNIKEVLDNNDGLEVYLTNEPGKLLLGLNTDNFNQLIYYTSITGEKRKVGIPEEFINRLLSDLTARERDIIKLRFGLEDGIPRKLDEVGKRFKLSPTRVFQIESLALRKMRHPARSRPLTSLFAFMDELDDRSQSLLYAIFGSEYIQEHIEIPPITSSEAD